MTVWTLCHGDGFGHNYVVTIFSNEEAAKARLESIHPTWLGAYWIVETKVLDWPECCVCGCERWEHTSDDCDNVIECGCSGFTYLPDPRHR